MYEILGLPCMERVTRQYSLEGFGVVAEIYIKKPKKWFETGVDVHYTEMKYAHFCTAIWHSDLQSTGTANAYIFTAAEQTAYW